MVWNFSVWSAIFLIKPLRKLEGQGRLMGIFVKMSVAKTDDEIKSLSVAFNMMLGNLRGMVKILILHFRIQIIKFSKLESKQGSDKTSSRCF